MIEIEIEIETRYSFLRRIQENNNKNSLDMVQHPSSFSSTNTYHFYQTYSEYRFEYLDFVMRQGHNRPGYFYGAIVQDNFKDGGRDTR